jgi:hypothetical protein
MRKLLIGLTLFSSMSSFAATGNDYCGNTIDALSEASMELGRIEMTPAFYRPKDNTDSLDNIEARYNEVSASVDMLKQSVKEFCSK